MEIEKKEVVIDPECTCLTGYGSVFSVSRETGIVTHDHCGRRVVEKKAVAWANGEFYQ